MALCLPLASRAGAAPRHFAILAPPPAAHGRTIDLRLVQDPEFGPTPIAHSGLIGETAVAPNATLGFGLLSVSPRRPSSGEWRYDPRAGHRKKASVRFLLKF